MVCSMPLKYCYSEGFSDSNHAISLSCAASFILSVVLIYVITPVAIAESSAKEIMTNGNLLVILISFNITINRHLFKRLLKLV